MTRIRFDQLSKQYLEAFLGPLGIVQRNLEVPGESKFVDVWFVPGTPFNECSNLGLLGRIATSSCSLEPFRNSPTRQQIRSCLLKLFWLHEDQRRQTEQAGLKQLDQDLPKLWILAATLNQPVIAEFGGHCRKTWEPGVYFCPEGFKTVIVAIDELPETEATLWLRLLGRDAVQQKAIAELLSLPINDPRRSKTLQLLVAWKITIEVDGIDEQDSNLMAALSQVYLEWEQQTKQQARQEGMEQGMERGIEQGQRALILRLVNHHLGSLPDDLRSQIETLPTVRLIELSEALFNFSTVEDLVVWLSQS